MSWYLPNVSKTLPEKPALIRKHLLIGPWTVNIYFSFTTLTCQSNPFNNTPVKSCETTVWRMRKIPPLFLNNCKML